MSCRTHATPKDYIGKILQEFESKKENIISILFRIQDNEEYNYVPPEAIESIADYMGVTPAKVYGIISFYTLFSPHPRGKYIIRVCTCAPCYIMGSSSIIDTLQKILNIKMGETTKDNMFTLESSSCLGLCDNAPAMMINHEVYKNLTEDKIKSIIEGKYHE